ncbi:MAG: glycosyltransferase, partial [Alphaproteobacteria bacterium]|nr:glycosyltransferase [Alphaproteobacteria bacterium]
MKNSDLGVIGDPDVVGISKSSIKAFTWSIWVVVPVYNFDLFLDDCFKSLNKQTYKNIHLCIFNDGSSDDSHKNIIKWLPVLKRSGITCHVIKFSVNK